MVFEIRFNSFNLALVSILVFSLLLYSFQAISINAQPSNNNNKDNNDDDLTTIKTKINLNNIDVENHDRLKIVAYLNGEGQTSYVDLKANKDETKIKDNSLTVNQV